MSFRLRPARIDRSKRTAESCPDRETTAQLGTVEQHVDFAPSKLRVRWDAVLRVECACIPDHHRPGTALAVGDHALEVGVFESMVLGAYGQMFPGRVHGRTFGHRPGYQNRIDRQSEVIVQPTGAENGPCAHAAQSPGSQDIKSLMGCGVASVPTPHIYLWVDSRPANVTALLTIIIKGVNAFSQP
jgi:hypothetical protein